MENGHQVVVTKEDVIEKLKDDGDFDKLRLQIIQKLKDNEELRSSIASVVKQSAVLHQAGSEKMKPRHLLDAIRADVGDRLMSQLSDGAWEIIKDEGGMKKEIKETIQCVYNRMVNPNWVEEGVATPFCNGMSALNKEDNGLKPVLVETAAEATVDNDPSEPPGFSLSISNSEETQKGGAQMSMPPGRTAEEQQNGIHHEFKDSPKRNGEAVSAVAQGMELDHSGDCSDDDPDLPPGFG